MGSFAAMLGLRITSPLGAVVLMSCRRLSIPVSTHRGGGKPGPATGDISAGSDYGESALSLRH